MFIYCFKRYWLFLITDTDYLHVYVMITDIQNQCLFIVSNDQTILIVFNNQYRSFVCLCYDNRYSEPMFIYCFKRYWLFLITDTDYLHIYVTITDIQNQCLFIVSNDQTILIVFNNQYRLFVCLCYDNRYSEPMFIYCFKRYWLFLITDTDYLHVYVTITDIQNQCLFIVSNDIDCF